MKICPTCRDEFLDTVTTCSTCAVALVHEIDFKPHDNLVVDDHTFLQGETAVIVEAPLLQCREVEKILKKAKLPCAVLPKTSCNDQNQVLGASCSMTYMVLIDPACHEQAQDALKGHFLALVAKEGQGHAVLDAINLDDELVTCPACNETSRLLEGECPCCGLVLSMPA